VRRLLPLLLLLPLALPAGASARDEVAPAAALSDSLLLEAPDFTALRPQLLTLTTDRVNEAAWALVPRLITLDRPDLLLGFLEFWEDRNGVSEPITRTRILAAIWDGAFSEGLYDQGLNASLDAWEWREPKSFSVERRGFDAFMIEFADQLLPHQDEGSLPAYFCLLYSDHAVEAAALLDEPGLADTWLRWYLDHPEGIDDGADGPVITDGAGEETASGAVTWSFLLTVGRWWPRGEVALAGDHVLVGGLFEQRLGNWFLRLPVEVRLGRTTRPYLVEQDGVRARSDRFDALYLGVEGGRSVVTIRAVSLEVFAGLGYDGIFPFRDEDVALATLNANLGLGLRWQQSGRKPLVGLDVRREWLGTRNEGPDSLSGGAWSLRLGAGLRFGPGDAAAASSD
jgi:hypothetical protein